MRDSVPGDAKRPPLLTGRPGFSLIIDWAETG